MPEQQEDKQYRAKLAYHDEELQNGIFSLVVTLCQEKANKVGLEQAKLEVIGWLEQLIQGLKMNE